MGIASLVIAILATVAIVVLVVVASTLTAQALQGIDGQNVNPQELQERLQDSPAATSLVVASLGMFACLFLYLVGFGLGIAGILQGQRKRVFSVLGTIFNGGVLLLFVGLILFGLVAGSV